jgi:hypothetical protein
MPSVSLTPLAPAGAARARGPPSRPSARLRPAALASASGCSARGLLLAALTATTALAEPPPPALSASAASAAGLLRQRVLPALAARREAATDQLVADAIAAPPAFIPAAEIHTAGPLDRLRPLPTDPTDARITDAYELLGVGV